MISSLDSTEVRTIDTPADTQIINLTRDQGVVQKIWLAATDGTITINSNVSNLTYEFVVYVPKAFTPNNDGQNDRLEVFGLPTDDFQMRIYSRWGDLVYKTSDVENFWNGKMEDGSIAAGSYMYQIEFLNEEGKLFNQQGSFVLLK